MPFEAWRRRSCRLPDARRRVGQLSPRLGRGNNGEQRRRPRRRSPQGHGGIAEIRRNPRAGRRFDGLVVQRELSVTSVSLWSGFGSLRVAALPRCTTTRQFLSWREDFGGRETGETITTARRSRNQTDDCPQPNSFGRNLRAACRNHGLVVQRHRGHRESSP